LTGKINENTSFAKDDFRNISPRFSPEARKANQSLADLLGLIAQAKRATPARSRSRGCWPEVVDRADPRHHEAASPAGKRACCRH